MYFSLKQGTELYFIILILILKLILMNFYSLINEDTGSLVLIFIFEYYITKKMKKIWDTGSLVPFFEIGRIRDMYIDT